MRQNLQILIVDDDPGMGRTLGDIFRAKGYEAEVAYSGREAVAEVGKRRFDRILSDIKMPEMGGVELYRLVKETQPELSVVFMTAYSTDRLVQEVLQAGAIATLTKALDIDLLPSLFSHLRKEGTRR